MHRAGSKWNVNKGSEEHIEGYILYEEDKVCESAGIQRVVKRRFFYIKGAVSLTYWKLEPWTVIDHSAIWGKL